MPLKAFAHPWALERGTLWVREDDGGEPVRVVARAQATFSEAHPEAGDALARAMGLADPALVSQRIGGGRRCFVACVDGAIASYGWVSRGSEEIGELERTFQMAADEAYIWDCATLPQFRDQHLYCALLSHIVVALHQEGIQRIWIGASLQNIPSIRAFARAGFQPVLDLMYLRILAAGHMWMTAHPTASAAMFARACAALST